MTLISKMTLIASSAALAGAAHFAIAHNAIELGHHASGQLFPHYHQTSPAPLPISQIPGIKGWADVTVGIEAIFKDEPDHDLFVLADDCSIQFTVIAADPGLYVFNDTGTAHVEIGGSFNLGNPPFHFHPLWHLEDAIYGQSYEIQIQFHDTSGQYTDSGILTIAFTPQCPGDVNLSAAVDVDDLLDVINSWGACPNFCIDECPADLDETCIVDVDDLLTVINAWGICENK
jgi:hypothetical protein